MRREFAALGLDFGRRAAIFEEGLAVIRQLWTEGRVDFHGEHFDYDDVAFYSGTELGPLMPVQSPPPIWVVSNPRLVGAASAATIERRIVAACRRIVRYGDGWMTLLPRRAPGGARRAARLDPPGRRRRGRRLRPAGRSRIR